MFAYRTLDVVPVGVESIAHTLNTATDTLVEDIEPYLLRIGLVLRTPRGRKLTSAGYEHLGAPLPEEGPPEPGDQRTLFPE